MLYLTLVLVVICNIIHVHVSILRPGLSTTVVVFFIMFQLLCSVYQAAFYHLKEFRNDQRARADVLPAFKGQTGFHIQRLQRDVLFQRSSRRQQLGQPFPGLVNVTQFSPQYL